MKGVSSEGGHPDTEVTERALSARLKLKARFATRREIELDLSMRGSVRGNPRPGDYGKSALSALEVEITLCDPKGFEIHL